MFKALTWDPPGLSPTRKAVTSLDSRDLDLPRGLLPVSSSCPLGPTFAGSFTWDDQENHRKRGLSPLNGKSYPWSFWAWNPPKTKQWRMSCRFLTQKQGSGPATRVHCQKTHAPSASRQVRGLPAEHDPRIARRPRPKKRAPGICCA